MKAAEMRKKSKANSYKAAISMQDQFINQADTQIEGRASQGYFDAQIQVVSNPIWKDYNLTETVINHYTGLGFQVELKPNVLSLKFIISWAEGDGTYAAD